MTKETYYRALAVVDRVIAELEAQGLKFGRFSTKLGYSGPYFQCMVDNAHSPKVRMLYRWAEALGVSFEYLLTGKNKGPFIPFEITFDKILHRQQELKYKNPVPAALKVCLCNIRHRRQKDMTLRVLFDFEKALQIKSLIEILTKTEEEK